MLTKHTFLNPLQEDILPFWLGQLDARGGFYGHYSYNLTIDKSAYKTAVISARYLWAFSRSYRLLKHASYHRAADHAFSFLYDKLIDKENGGLFWAVDASGNVVSDSKQTYAQAYGVYSLSEYALINPHSVAKKEAIELFYLIEEKCYSKKYNGYLEAFSNDWSSKEETKIGSRDPQLIFTTNTHIHLLEAYTNLYRLWPDFFLKERIKQLLKLIQIAIFQPDGYCATEFNQDWQPLTAELSYGHDIETAWLLKECLDVCQIEDPSIERMIINLSHYVLKHGRFSNGAVKTDSPTKHNQDEHKVWWVQAEAVIGFYNAFQMTTDLTYQAAALDTWEYINNYFIDKRPRSEWFAQVNQANMPIELAISDEWKGPYHTVRMYLEMIERLHKTDPCYTINYK